MGRSWGGLGLSWGALVALLGRSWGCLGPSWIVLDCLGAAWVVLGSFEPSWALLGRFWGHFGIHFGVQNWLIFFEFFLESFFGVCFGQFLARFRCHFGDHFGTRLAQEGTEMGPRGQSRASKTKTPAFAKALKHIMFFQVFGVQGLPRRARNLSKNRIRKWTSKIPIFLINFGTTLVRAKNC